MSQHSHITILHQLYLAEAQPFRKVHRMIDLFESIIKMHTVVILAEYVKHNKLSETAKGLLAHGLKTPSLGTWQLFSRVLFCELQLSGYIWLIDELQIEFIISDNELNSQLETGKISFPTFDKEQLQILKSERKKRKSNFDDVIALRNSYAHGATPTDAQCEIDIKKLDSFLTQLMESKWLVLSSLEVMNGKVFITTSNGTLSLHPMLLYRKEDNEASFAFFNDLKNDKIGLLNYPLSKHYKEKDFYTEFHEHLPLNEWKKVGNNEFYQRIEELTETFKGRTIEREKLLQFVLKNHKGYFSIQGNPGIGKSALIAQFFKDLRAHDEIKKLQVIEYFIRRGTNQAQVEYMFNYLIRRTDEVFSGGKDIRAEGKMVFDLQNQLFTKWRLWGEQAKGQQLLFLIDGLDEGVENNVVTYLPRENFENILIIYGSRPGGHKSIDELWATLPVLNHTKLELSGLGKEDIRALIYEVANKYEVERESVWIDAVQKRSQGNPLYLKLLCDAIEYGSIAINDVNALPEKIDEYYKAILQRYAQDAVDGDALLAGLYTFAAAKDYLTMSHLGIINKLGNATMQRIGSTLKEVLYENPLTEEVLDYQLFHESFREYLIKEKRKEVNDAAVWIIDFCGSWQQLEGSWEQRYALEHYATHLTESKIAVHHKALMDLIHNDAYAGEQIKTLKGFDASNRLYQLALIKASELNQNENALEAALCLIDIKYEEANDAPKVVAMITNGEIDLALMRIDSFGGADKEGVKRKFILYMLCLMELTLLESKYKSFRKEGIEKLLKHLDEQLPVDHSILTWNNFFPSYTVFLMACEWVEMGLDYLIVYKRTDNWERDWLKEKGLYTDIQFEVLLECARGINDDRVKSNALKDISTELAKQGKIVEAASVMQEALECARGISNDFWKSRALKDISAELAKQGKIEEALECARGISDDFWKSRALKDISAELAKQGKTEEAGSAMQESLECARVISDDEVKFDALKYISAELTKQGKTDEALECIRGISDDDYKSFALKDISAELSKQGKTKEALECIRGISYDPCKSSALKYLSAELSKQGKTEEAVSALLESLECARGISYDPSKSDELKDISAELAKQGKTEEATSVMQEAIECARGISYDVCKSTALKNISAELAKQGKDQEASSAMGEALKCALSISDDYDKSDELKEISVELAKQGNTQEALESAREISVYAVKCDTLKDISTKLVKQGKTEEALECARVISNYEAKSTALKVISAELAKQGKTEEAKSAMQETLEDARGISDDYDKSTALKDISAELTKQGKTEEALECARGISDYYNKSIAMYYISAELVKQGKTAEALEYIRVISANDIKSSALKEVSDELAKQGKTEEAASAMQESLECAAQGISYDYTKSSELNNISVELVKQGKIEEALECARGISNDGDKSTSLKDISAELAKQGEILEAASAMQEALECARGISHVYEKSGALQNISAELAKQGNFPLAEQIGLEIPFIADRQNC